MKGDVMTDPRKITILIKTRPINEAMAKAKAQIDAAMQNTMRKMPDYAIYGEMWGVENAIDGTCRVVPDEPSTPPLLAPPKENDA